MEFETLAPTLSGNGLVEADVTTIELPAAKEASVTPTLDKTKVLAVLAEFASSVIPYTSLGQKHGLTTEQIRTLHREFRAVKAAKTADDAAAAEVI